MKRIPLVLASSALSLCAPPIELVAETAQNASSFFPLQLGNQWSYSFKSTSFTARISDTATIYTLAFGSGLVQRIDPGEAPARLYPIYTDLVYAKINGVEYGQPVPVAGGGRTENLVVGIGPAGSW